MVNIVKIACIYDLKDNIFLVGGGDVITFILLI